MRTQRTIKFSPLTGKVSQVSELFGNLHIPKPQYNDLIKKKRKDKK